ncbi:MAG: hypothetical protein KGI52_15880 [Burkholderiales bacterium]|nr:hypothetical protein [Burkholderiales bacterium]
MKSTSVFVVQFRLVAFHACALVLALCAPFETLRAEDHPAVRDWISSARVVAEKYKNAFERGDVKTMLSLYSDRFIAGNGGIDTMRRTLQSHFPEASEIKGKKIYEEKLNAPVVISDDLTVLVVFPVDRRVVGLSKSVDPLMDMYVVVSRDRGGSWTVVHSTCMNEDDVRRAFVPSYSGSPPLPTPSFRSEHHDMPHAQISDKERAPAEVK